jgi:hypothetical protein
VANTYAVNVMMETAAAHVETALYDSVLDGVAMIGQGVSANTVPTYTFLRCVSHASAGHYYEGGPTVDAGYNFFSGALPTGTDSWATTSGQTYRAHLAAEASVGAGAVFRYVLGCGYSPEDARQATRGVPNVSASFAREVIQRQVNALPPLVSSNGQERLAWRMHEHTLIHNTRTETDESTADLMAYDGHHRRLAINGLGRWNAMWTFDTALGLLGSTSVDPGICRDSMSLLFNNRMNQSTGFLNLDPANPTRASSGQFLHARLLLRYALATGDTAFATSLYPKLELIWTWWTVNASSAYRHPTWPTVFLFTTLHDTESQESSPVTSSGNYPAGDDFWGSRHRCGQGESRIVVLSRSFRGLGIPRKLRAGW